VEPLRFALSLPNFGGYADARTVASLASTAEAAGWDGVFVWDHLLGWDANVVGDAWTILTAIALETERVQIGPMVTPLARRRPWVVARQVVTLDRLSNGRLTLGVGLGEPRREEFEVFGEPGDERVRGRTLDEALEVLTGLLSGAAFAHDGEHFHVEEVTFAPTCLQEPRVPIWVGGAWPHHAPFRRAARYEGMVPISVPDPSGEVTPSVDQLREAVGFVRALRGGTPFDIVFTGIVPDDPERTRDLAHELASFGTTWWQMSPDHGQDPATFEAIVAKGPPVV
jgi:alkanesulfonate monooxygenase SsuD/methylene tetrahydromethanopterin reductase-like flavin-dependent oxidoreductase (luciferase family)